MKKRVKNLLTATLLMGLLAACSDENSNPLSPTPTPESAAAATASEAVSTITPVEGAVSPRPALNAATFNVGTTSELGALSNHTNGSWTFSHETDSSARPHVNKYRRIRFTVAETGDAGTHWYVQFRSIETYQGQPHERGVFIEADPTAETLIRGFWANVRYVVRARSYAKTSAGHYYSIGENLTEVARLSTPGCPAGTQRRDGLRNGEPYPENQYRCERIPQSALPAPPPTQAPAGMITSEAASAWGVANGLTSFAVASVRNHQATSYANVFIFYGGEECPSTYLFRRGIYTSAAAGLTRRNGCAHQSSQ